MAFPLARGSTKTPKHPIKRGDHKSRKLARSKGKRAWRVPANAAHGMGAEITEIEYELKRGDNTVTAVHPTSAIAAEELAWDDLSNFYAVFSKLPAGRLWLMIGNKGDSLYLATDRVPRSSLWLDNEINPLQAVLAGEPVDTKLTGLVV